MKTNHGQVSESLRLGIILTLAGGFQDAYSYNCRDQVFANAQTGNIVLLGQNLASGNIWTALRYLFPVLAFLLGVYLTEWIRQLGREHNRIHWRQVVVLVETGILTAVGIMPESMNIPANVMLSFACAMQVDSFRKIKGIPCATTMCIGNMRSATEMLSQYHMTKDSKLKKKSLHYYFIILVFAAGAAAGAVCTVNIGKSAIWMAAGLLFLAFLMMFIKEERVDGNQENIKE